MKKRSLSFLLQIACLAALLVSGCQRTNAAGVLPAGPISWIDKPHDGASFPLEAVEIISHSNDPGGVAQVEMSANGNVIANVPVSGNLAQAQFTWKPAEAGNYVIRVRAQNGSGAWGDYTQVNIKVGEPTLTPTIALPVCDFATPTLACPPPPPTPVGFTPPPPPVCGVPTLAPVAGIPTATIAQPNPPSLAGEPTATLPCVSPTPTLVGGLIDTPTSTLAGPTPVPGAGCDISTPTPVCVSPTPTTVISFTPTLPSKLTFSHVVSTDLFYYGSCSPNSISVQVQVSDPGAVNSVVMFQRLESQSQVTGWDGGTAMIPKGGGVFSLTIMGNSVPEHDNFEIANWVYQLVATNANGKTIGSSPLIFDDADLAACAQPKPKKVATTVTQAPRRVPTTVTPVPRKPPSIKPTTVTPIVIK